jgi:hypothetical protein
MVIFRNGEFELTKVQTNVIFPSRKVTPGMDTDISQNCIIHGGPTYSAPEKPLRSESQIMCHDFEHRRYGILKTT